MIPIPFPPPPPTSVCHTVSVGTTPGKEALKGVPTFGKGKGKTTEEGKGKEKGGAGSSKAEEYPAAQGIDSMAKVAGQTATIMSLLKVQESLNPASKTGRVWLGDGLGSIPKRVHERMLKWEVMDMNDFRPRSAGDCSISESDTEKLIVLPGFEVSQPRKKPVEDIFTWIQCFSRYTAAMAKEYPGCTPGFMSHLLTVMKAYCEAKQLAWQEYDVAFREKMAATGKKDWTGMDVSLYHELCSSRPKQTGTPEEVRPGQKRKRPAAGGPKVCWLYNDGECTIKNCKFAHRCEWCMGNHPRRACSSRSGGDFPRPLPRLPGSYSGVQWGRQ